MSVVTTSTVEGNIVNVDISTTPIVIVDSVSSNVTVDTIGPRGPQGFQGVQGSQGPLGPQGNQGSQGPTGTQGNQGPTGPQGPQGTEGTQGNQGPTGPQGTQGTQGNQGPTGTQGNQGPTGPQGTQGTEGTQGPIGPQGIEGTQGNQGPTGPQGTQGTEGTQGPTGPQGIEGTQGNQGPIGPQGTQGTQGNQGPTGPQGTQGTEGTQGPTGPQGIEGTQGNQGPIGPQGTQGATGFVEEFTAVSYEFVDETFLSIPHSLDSKNLHISVYDSTYSLLIPESIEIPTTDTVEVSFFTTQSGNVVITRGGHIVSGSISWDNITSIPSPLLTSSIFAVTGSNNFVGDQTVTGSLKIQGPGGDEGGEMQLGLAQTNTTLTGSIVFDVYRDKLRLFEGGGNNRGAFLNVASQSNGVSSEIITSTTVSKIETISSASYAALSPPVSGTLYIIID